MSRYSGAERPSTGADLPTIDVEHLGWLARFLAAAAVGGTDRNVNGEMRAACEVLGSQLTNQRIIRNRAGEPYLSRYYLLGGPTNPAAAWDERGGVRPGTQWQQLPTSVYLHHLHCGDDRGVLHSHPWNAAVSLILAGGYSEDRRDGDRVVTRQVDPLELNVLRSDDFHRIDLSAGDAWSFFVVGHPTGGWHFWDPVSGAVTRAGTPRGGARR